MNTLNAKHYLLSMKMLKDNIPSPDQHPFNLDVVRNLDLIEFHPKLTYIIGENGSGKSTLLEAIATAWGFNPEGGSRNFSFSTRSSHSNLHDYIRLTKSFKRPRDGFFLRAESFYNVASSIDELDEIPTPAPPIKNSYGGKSLHQQSHGESFSSLFLHRFNGKGLYILDEPEAALSPAKQLAMLARLHQLIEEDSQFIISTHSPILMAYPYSKILVIENGKLEEYEYKDTEHYIITKTFLNSPEKLLQELIG